MAIIKVQFEANEADVKRYTDLLIKAGVAADTLGKKVKEVGDQSKDWFGKATASIDAMIGAAKAFLALGLVREVFNIAKEASQLAASAEGISSAFRNLGGTKQDLQDLSSAVGGTVSQLKLMQIAVKAMQKGLDLKQIAEVLAFVDKQADATGESFELMATKLLKGMKDVPSLMDEVKKKSKELGVVVGKTGDAYDRLNVAQEDLKLAFGEFLNQSGLTDWLTGFSLVALDIVKGIKGIDGAVSVAGKNITDLIKMRNDLQVIIDKPVISVGDANKQVEAILNLSTVNVAIKSWEDIRANAFIAAEEAAAVAGAKAGEEYEKAFAKAVKEQNEKTRQARLLERFEEGKKETIDNLVKIDIGASLDKTLEGRKGGQRRTQELLGEAVEPTKEIKFNIEAAALSAFAMVDTLSSLGDTNADRGKKFFAVLQGLLSIVALIPGPQQLGFGIAAAGVGTIGRVINKNKGGYIPGYGPDADSVLMAATPGEFVVRRSSTQMSPLLLDAINSGELDDKIFKKLQAAPPLIILNQEQVVAAIERMPQVDLYKSGSALYEARKSADGRRASRKQRLTI